MELHLKKNTAAELMFPMVDSTTPANLKSGVSPTDTGYYKDGAGSWTSLAITDTATEIGTTGMYTIELTAAEMNHDLIMVKMAVSGAADTVIIIRTFTNNINDVALASVCTNTRLAELDAANIPADIDAILTDTADMQPKLGTPAGASISADILTIDDFVDDLESRLTAARAGYLDNLSAGAVALEATLTAIKGAGWTTETLKAIKEYVDDIGAAGAGLSAIPWNASWDAEVQSECDDALNAYDPPTRAELTTDTSSIITEVNANETKIDAVKVDTAAILLDTGTDGVVVAAGSKTGYALSTAGVDAILDDVVEGTLTMRQMLRLFMSALAGKSAGGGTVTLTFRDNADAKARITATVDANGNRTAMTLDGT
jgi:hypothetical protein